MIIRQIETVEKKINIKIEKKKKIFFFFLLKKGKAIKINCYEDNTTISKN